MCSRFFVIFIKSFDCYGEKESKDKHFLSKISPSPVFECVHSVCFSFFCDVEESTFWIVLRQKTFRFSFSCKFVGFKSCDNTYEIYSRRWDISRDVVRSDSSASLACVLVQATITCGQIVFEIVPPFEARFLLYTSARLPSGVTVPETLVTSLASLVCSSTSGDFARTDRVRDLSKIIINPSFLLDVPRARFPGGATVPFFLMSPEGLFRVLSVF